MEKKIQNAWRKKQHSSKHTHTHTTTTTTTITRAKSREKEKPQGRFLKYFELNKTGNTTYQKFLVAVNTGLRRRCVALSRYIRKEKGLKSTV